MNDITAYKKSFSCAKNKKERTGSFKKIGKIEEQRCDEKEIRM